MAGDILTNIVILIAVTGILTYFTTVARRTRPTIDAATGARTFGYVRAFKALAMVGLILPLFMGIAALQIYRSGQSDYLIFVGIFLIFTAICAYLLLELFVARLIVSDERITSVSPWRRERTFRWDEIESIRYSKLSQAYVIIGPGKKKIYASEYLNGWANLTVEFRQRIPPERWKSS